MKDKKNPAHHEEPDADGGIADQHIQIEVLGLGKKSAIFARREGYELTGVYDNLGDKPTLDDIAPISRNVVNNFVAGNYDKVVVVYTNYINSLTQIPRVRQLLPVSSLDLEKMIEEIDQTMGDKQSVAEEATPVESYIFEPGVHQIIQFILPKLVETELYEGVLESAASEHSARMLAMKNASENAGEIIKELTLNYNKARQAAITQEISEIAGGAAALG